MGKRTGTKSSRSERKAGRERARRARQHGLPERNEPPARARVVAPEPTGVEGEGRTSAAPSAKAASARGVPTVVKVVGGGLAVLLAVYLLTHYRDRADVDATPEPAASALAPPSATPVLEEATPTPPPEAEGKLPAPAAAAEPAAATTIPSKPVVATPVVPAPEPPKSEKPKAPAAPRLDVQSVGAVPAPVPAPAPAKPVAPKPPAPATPPPADNPY